MKTRRKRTKPGARVPNSAGFTCDLCHQIFNSRKLLNNHVVVCTKDEKIDNNNIKLELKQEDEMLEEHLTMKSCPKQPKTKKVTKGPKAKKVKLSKEERQAQKERDIQERLRIISEKLKNCAAKKPEIAKPNVSTDKEKAGERQTKLKKTEREVKKAKEIKAKISQKLKSSPIYPIGEKADMTPSPKTRLTRNSMKSRPTTPGGTKKFQTPEEVPLKQSPTFEVKPAESYAEQRTDSYAKQRTDSYAKQRTDSYAKQRTDSYAKQRTDSYAKQRTDSYAKRRTDSYAKQAPDSHAKQPLNSYVRRPPNSYEGDSNVDEGLPPDSYVERPGDAYVGQPPDGQVERPSSSYAEQPLDLYEQQPSRLYVEPVDVFVQKPTQQPRDSCVGQPPDSYAGQSSDSYAGQSSDSYAGQSSDPYAGQSSGPYAGQSSDSYAGQPPDSYLAQATNSVDVTLSQPSREKSESQSSTNGRISGETQRENSDDSEEVENIGHTSTEFKCKKCGEEFGHGFDLLRHARKKHTYPRIRMSPSVIQKYHEQTDRSSCPICNKPLYTNCKSFFIKHLNTHSYEKNFECGVCKKKFRRLDHMKVHEKRHIV